MNKNNYILAKDECYCDIIDLYGAVAHHMGFEDTSKLQYDCSKICASKKVQDEVIKYYVNEIGINYPNVVECILLPYGPKANIDSDAYIVVVEDGFIIDGGDN